MDTIASHKRQKNAVSRHGGSQRGAEATKTAEKAVAGGSEDELTSGDAALALVSSPARSTSPVVGSGSPQTTPPGPVLTTSPLMASSPSFYPLGAFASESKSFRFCLLSFHPVLSHRYRIFSYPTPPLLAIPFCIIRRLTLGNAFAHDDWPRAP